MTDNQIDQELKVKLSAQTSLDLALDASILATYEIIEILGEGGFGVVYKAQHKTVPGIVALKVVRKELANKDTAVKRLEQEARAIISLNDPNIVRLREFGTGSEGSAFLVMDFIEGRSLRQELENRALSIDETLSIAIQVCKGLAHAHAKGIMHRDLKPENIMLIGDQFDLPGTVKLVDFGISKVLEDGREVNLTKTGEVVGSPYFMSPEQGLGLQTDERSDIYSLGCVLYEMLSGSVPFDGQNAMQVILKHINEKAAALSETPGQQRIPNSLSDLALKTIEKKQEDRYRKVVDLQNDLELVKKGRPPVGLKRRFNTKLITATVCGIVLGIFISIMYSVGPQIASLIFEPHWIRQIGVATEQKKVGNFAMAKATLRNAFKEATQAHASIHDLGVIQGELGKICRDQDSYLEARKYYEKALSYIEKTDDKARLAEYYDDLGLSQNQTGLPQEALLNGKKGLELKVKLYGEKHFFTSNSLQKLGKTYYSLGNYLEAENAFKRAREIELSTQGDKSANMSNIDWFLARIYLAQNKLPQAETAYKECITIRDDIFGPDDAVSKYIKDMYAYLLKLPGSKVDPDLIHKPIK